MLLVDVLHRRGSGPFAAARQSDIGLGRSRLELGASKLGRTLLDHSVLLDLAELGLGFADVDWSRIHHLLAFGCDRIVRIFGLGVCPKLGFGSAARTLCPSSARPLSSSILARFGHLCWLGPTSRVLDCASAVLSAPPVPLPPLTLLTRGPWSSADGFVAGFMLCDVWGCLGRGAFVVCSTAPHAGRRPDRMAVGRGPEVLRGCRKGGFEAKRRGRT